MRRILHVSYSMDLGGGPLAIKKIIKDVDSLHHFVAGNKGPLLDEFKLQIGSTYVCQLNGKNILLSFIRLCFFIQRNRINIIHLHGRGAGSFVRFVKCFKPSLLVIYTLHGFYPDSISNVFLKVFYINFERLFVFLIDRFHFVSMSEQKLFEGNISHDSVFQRKNFFLPNYIEFDNGFDNLNLVIHKPVKFIFIGRLCYQKGIDILLRSFCLLKEECTLDIVGYGEMEQYLIQFIEDNKLSNRIKFIGKYQNAAALMKNYSAIIVPSRYEGMPFTILEAMAQMVPVITTRVAGVIDLLYPDYPYSSENLEENTFAQTIDRFIKDYNEGTQIVSDCVIKSIQKVEKGFSKARVVQMYKDFLYHYP